MLIMQMIYSDCLYKTRGEIYGQQCMSYNIHASVHLAQEAKLHGSLDNVSAFVFENYLGKLKKSIRKPQHPLQQVVKRFSERMSMTVKVPYTRLQEEHQKGPLPQLFGDCTQFKILQSVCEFQK